MRTIFFFLCATVLTMFFSYSNCHAQTEQSPDLFQKQYGEYDWDLHKKLPWQPALLSSDQIRPAMWKAMKKFNACYPLRQIKPNGKGISEKEFQSVLEATRKALPQEPNRVGPRRPLTLLSGEKAQNKGTLRPIELHKEIQPLIRAITHAYARANAKQAPALEDCYRRVVQAILASEFYPGRELPGWIGGGYGWRNWGQRLAQMDATLPPVEKQRLLEVLSNFAGANFLYREHPAAGSDMQLNLFYNVFRFVARMEDGPVKWQRLQAIRRGLDLAAVEESYITQDGGILHHGGHHISYASYSFGHALKHQVNFTRSGIIGKHSKLAAERYRSAVTAWAFNSLLAELPWPVQLRPAPLWEAQRAKGQNPGLTPHFALQAATLSALLNGTEVENDKTMARLVCSKSRGNVRSVPKVWQPLMHKEMNKPLEGHRPFPVMGLSVHRRDDWVVMVRGANKFYRGGEVYADANYPGAYLDHIMHGALFIYSCGKEGRFTNSVDSGFRTEGFDPNMFPGTTTAMMSNAALAGRFNPDYFGSSAAQGGGTDLDENGVWAWNPGNVRKSAFFFGNRITMVSHDIQVKGKDVRTTLLQQVHDDLLNEPLSIDGKMFAGKMSQQLSGKQSHTIFDAYETGYYLPAGNPDLQIKRGAQGYTYALPGHLKPGVDKSILSKLKNRNQLRAALDQFEPIVRPVSLAYFAHGANPKEAACRFTALIRTTPEKLAEFQRTMDSANDNASRPFSLVTKRAYHWMYDRATRTHALATFDANAKIAPTAARTTEVVQVNRPATLMWHVSDSNKMAFSIASTDKSNRKPFEVTLVGVWAILPQNEPLAKQSAAGGQKVSVQQIGKQNTPQTLLTIEYHNQSPVHIVLIQAAK